MKRNNVIKSAILATVFIAAGTSSAQSDSSDTYLREDPNYQPPTSEPLYEPVGKRGAPLTFGSQLQLGGILSFGLSSTPGSDAVTASLAGGQLVYRAGLSSWSRFEAGVQFLTGVAGYDDADITVPYMLMARVGYGYSLGSNIFATFGAGFGTAGGDFDGKVNDVAVKSDDLMTGFASNVEFAINLNPKGTFEFTGGLGYTSIGYNLDSIEGTSETLDKSITIQIPRMFVGMSINI